MKQVSVLPHDPHMPGLTRRRFLATSVATGALVGFVAGLPRAASAVTATGDQFLKVSEFVTRSKALDPAISARFWQALTKRDSGFAASVSDLSKAIAASGATDMDAFIVQPSLDPALRATAQKIVQSWYLGIVGTSDVELITYAESLMYRPTRGILIVPTYG
ncbi:sorbitol dehydrogenase, partial [Thioclava sp. BHET1]